jgi:hypothetical protein
MLTLAQEKSQNLLIEWVHEDIRHFQLNRKFDLITLVGNAFQALLTDDDQTRMWLCVKLHLNPDGIFAFNTRNPNPDDMRQRQTMNFGMTLRTHMGNL